MMRRTKKFLGLILVFSMLLSLAACNKNENPSVQPTPAQSQSGEELPIMKITVSLPSTDEHVEANEYYDKLCKELNERLRMDITWEWLAMSTYYDSEHLGLKISTGDVADVLVVGNDPSVMKAAEEGLFWDLGPYIDDYDNLKTIPTVTRLNASYNGKMYGIPRSRTLARNGFAYRVDWLDNLGLKEPTTWDDFYNMLYAFTYNDPDGNGVDDTVGLGLDQWSGQWDIMMTWFGVPNEWGLTEDGNFISKYETEEYKTALKAFRKLYSDGLINNGSNGINDFEEYTAGQATKSLIRTGLAGCGVQCLDDERKAEEYFEKQGLSEEDDPILTLAGYVDTGKGKLCYPTTGMNNMIAVSKKNIKTEEQLRRVLQFLNDFNDGDILNLVEYGWEDITWHKDDNGYLSLYTTEELEAAGRTVGKYNDGFNQLPAYFTAAANERPITVAPASIAIKILEQKLYDENIKYCVPNYGAEYKTETYVNIGDDLIKTMAEMQVKYIKGEIDDAGLEEAINTWKSAGGDQIIIEMNEMYHKNK